MNTNETNNNDNNDNKNEIPENKNDHMVINILENNENLFSPSFNKGKKIINLFKQIVAEYENDIQKFINEVPEQSIDLLYKYLKLNLNELHSSSLSFKQLLPSITDKELILLLDLIHNNFLHYCSTKEGIELVIALLNKVQTNDEFPFLIRITQVYIYHFKDIINNPKTFDILSFILSKENTQINDFVYSQLFENIKEITLNTESFNKLQTILDKYNPTNDSESFQRIKKYIEELKSNKK